MKTDYVNYSQNYFKHLDINNIGNIKDQCFYHCASKFNNIFNVEVINKLTDTDGFITIVVVDDNTNIMFPQLIDSPQNNFFANAGDLFSFHSSVDYYVEEGKTVLYFRFGFIDKANSKIYGDGPKQFEITAILKDEYKITINSTSLEDALNQAKEIPIHYWEHLDLYPELDKSVILRYSKWGNFTGKELL